MKKQIAKMIVEIKSNCYLHYWSLNKIMFWFTKNKGSKLSNISFFNSSQSFLSFFPLNWFECFHLSNKRWNNFIIEFLVDLLELNYLLVSKHLQRIVICYVVQNHTLILWVRLNQLCRITMTHLLKYLAATNLFSKVSRLRLQWIHSSQ